MTPPLQGPPRDWVERRFVLHVKQEAADCNDVAYVTVGPSDPIGPVELIPLTLTRPYVQD